MRSGLNFIAKFGEEFELLAVNLILSQCACFANLTQNKN